MSLAFGSATLRRTIKLLSNSKNCFSTSIPQPKRVTDGYYVLKMPKMSPNMESGILSKWLRQPSQVVEVYDVICEVETDNLSEQAYKVGKFKDSVTMLVESQDKFKVVKHLKKEGETVSVNTIIALLSDDSVAKNLDNIEEVLMYKKELPSLTWQCYLKENAK